MHMLPTATNANRTVFHKEEILLDHGLITIFSMEELCKFETPATVFSESAISQTNLQLPRNRIFFILHSLFLICHRIIEIATRNFGLCSEVVREPEVTDLYKLQTLLHQIHLFLMLYCHR